MAKIILRAGKVAIKIILPLVILGLIFYSIRMLTPARAQTESEPNELTDVLSQDATIDGQIAELYEQAEIYDDMGKYPQAEQILKDIIQT